MQVLRYYVCYLFTHKNHRVIPLSSSCIIYIHIDEHTVKGVFACLEHANNSFEFCRVIVIMSQRQFRVRTDPPRAMAGRTMETE